MAGRRSRRFLWPLLLALVAAGIGFCRSVRDPWPAEQGIVVPPGEERYTARAVAATVALLNARHEKDRPFPRSAFAKAHACLRASLVVPELEPRLRHGLFALPGRYDAWIRLSNGASPPASDRRRDAHGLAVKVMGVAGDKLLEDESAADTQDFLLSDSPRFPVASVRDYTELVEALARGRRLAYLLDDSLLPWRWRVREGWFAFRARKAPPSGLLQTRYYSGTAYRLGPAQFVKYGARPCQTRHLPRRDRTDDMLRRGLEQELQGGACLELMVQLQVPGRNMPVEDPTVLWSEEDSPFVPVARITIPARVTGNAEQDRFCADLSFTPWHSLPDHEPVGGLNRLRKAVYRELSRYRHARNGTVRAEPRGYCLDLTGATCPAAVPVDAPSERDATATPAPPATRPPPREPSAAPPGSAPAAPEPAPAAPESASPLPSGSERLPGPTS